MKKYISIILLCFISISLFGCNSKDLKANIPDYEIYKNGDRFVISSFISPQMTDENIKDYKDAGFNEIHLSGFDSIISTKVQDACKACERNELPFYVFAENSSTLLDILDCSKIYDDYNYMKGMYIYDEPMYNDGQVNIGGSMIGFKGLTTLKDYVEPFDNNYTNKTFFVNLNPLESTFMFEGYSYSDYVNYCVEEICLKSQAERWISADSYPLKKNGLTQKYLKPQWLRNLSELSRVKYVDYRDGNLKTNFFVQSIPYSTDYDRTPTYNDLSLQLYTLWAFGYDAASYFTYQSPKLSYEFNENQLGIIDRDGNKTSTYFEAKKINNELLSYDYIYMHFAKKWFGVIPVIGKKNKNGTNESFIELENYGKKSLTSINLIKGLKNIESDYDTLVGCMKDKDGNNGFMLVNYNDTSLNYSGEVVLTLENAVKAMVLKKGLKTIVDVKNNTIAVNLDVGEGAFVIPFRGE